MSIIIHTYIDVSVNVPNAGIKKPKMKLDELNKIDYQYVTKYPEERSKNISNDVKQREVYGLHLLKTISDVMNQEIYRLKENMTSTEDDLYNNVILQNVSINDIQNHPDEDDDEDLTFNVDLMCSDREKKKFYDNNDDESVCSSDDISEEDENIIEEIQHSQTVYDEDIQIIAEYINPVNVNKDKSNSTISSEKKLPLKRKSNSNLSSELQSKRAKSFSAQSKLHVITDTQLQEYVYKNDKNAEESWQSKSFYFASEKEMNRSEIQSYIRMVKCKLCEINNTKKAIMLSSTCVVLCCLECLKALRALVSPKRPIQSIRSEIEMRVSKKYFAPILFENNVRGKFLDLNSRKPSATSRGYNLFQVDKKKKKEMKNKRWQQQQYGGPKIAAQLTCSKKTPNVGKNQDYVGNLNGEIEVYRTN